MFDGHAGERVNGSAAILVLLVLGAPAQPASPGSPAERIAFITDKAHLHLSTLTEQAIVGHWGRGGGLAGKELYLFPDRSYVHTEWADIMPETVMDKGRWALETEGLVFTPDPDVTWPQRSDRRFAVVQAKEESGDLLFGLERSFDLLERILGGNEVHAGSTIQAMALRRQADIDATRGPAFKARLLKRAWRPEAYDK